MTIRTGFAELALVRGHVPHYKEMVKLGRAIVNVLVNEFGTKEFLRRVSNPLWYQCLACTVGWEWETSGSGTVVTQALKDALSRENLGIKIVGGKGKKSRRTLPEITRIGDEFNLKEKIIEKTQKISKLSTKVDNACLQDNHQIYFHSMFLDEKGNYSLINQGMCVEEGTARRYHWLSNVEDPVEEPYDGILGDKKKNIVLDLTDKDSRECRKSIVDIVNDQKPEKIQTMLLTIKRPQEQKVLTEFIRSRDIRIVKLPNFLRVPTRINQNALRIVRGEISGFEDLLSTKGVGPATIRGLAYISDLIYGTETSWKDPMSYSFSHGTKSGRPYYVDKKSMRMNAEILLQAVEEAKIGKQEKLDAIRRLNRFV